MSDVETISQDEKAYHYQLIEQIKSAQAALNSWSGYLSQKYQLGKDDRIDEYGNIYRSTKE